MKVLSILISIILLQVFAGVSFAQMEPISSAAFEGAYRNGESAYYYSLRYSSDSNRPNKLRNTSVSEYFIDGQVARSREVKSERIAGVSRKIILDKFEGGVAVKCEIVNGGGSSSATRQNDEGWRLDLDTCENTVAPGDGVIMTPRTATYMSELTGNGKGGTYVRYRIYEPYGDRFERFSFTVNEIGALTREETTTGFINVKQLISRTVVSYEWGANIEPIMRPLILCEWCREGVTVLAEKIHPNEFQKALKKSLDEVTNRRHRRSTALEQRNDERMDIVRENVFEFIPPNVYREKQIEGVNSVCERVRIDIQDYFRTSANANWKQGRSECSWRIYDTQIPSGEETSAYIERDSKWQNHYRYYTLLDRNTGAFYEDNFWPDGKIVRREITKGYGNPAILTWRETTTYDTAAKFDIPTPVIK